MSNKNNFQFDFIGIGVPRSGTTWIYECLKEHPQICMSAKKEAGIFRSLKRTGQFSGSFSHLYSLNFNHCLDGQIRGEYSPLYFTEKEVMCLIRKYYPKIKIIICLRNPIERAYSHFLGLKIAERTKIKSFEEVVSEGIENECLKLGFYSSRLIELFKLFPKENVLVLIYEDIVKDPIAFIQNVYKFLGVKADFVPLAVNKRVRQLPQKVYRSILLNKITIKVLRIFRQKHLKPIARFFKKVTAGRAINIINFITSKNFIPLDRRKAYLKPCMDKQVRRYLQRIYSSEIKDLENLIGRDLSFWQ